MAAGIKDIRNVNIQTLREAIQTHLRDVWWPLHVKEHNKNRKRILERMEKEADHIDIGEENDSGLTEIFFEGFSFFFDLRERYADQLPSGPHDAFFIEATAE
ncbi:MAG: hypothetical protein H6860_02885 [Rhodospirillales bacterium]|nr:hypothetical protein [Alphaproteobacteria bacterium]MCB9981324.1 hypothetical protein [Rhodospirillales bacterium]